MVGLLKQPGDDSAAAPSMRGPTDPMNSDGQEPNVSPEEQAAYDQFVNNAYSLIYDEKTLPHIKQSLEGGGDPVSGLANTTVMVVKRLNDSAKQAGKQINEDVLFHGGAAILEDLADYAKTAGIHDYDDKEMEAATLRAMDMGREVLSQDGTVNKDQLKGEFQQLMAADKQGKLGELLPGLEQAERKMPQGDDADEEADEPKPDPDADKEGDEDEEGY